MNTTIIVALITGGFSFLGAILATALSNSKTLYRIDQLEKKMDLHNNAVMRLTVVEEKVSQLEQRSN